MVNSVSFVSWHLSLLNTEPRHAEFHPVHSDVEAACTDTVGAVQGKEVGTVTGPLIA
jgi:hypothetical protein